MSHLFGCIKPSDDLGGHKLPENIGTLLIDTPTFQLYTSGASKTTFFSIGENSKSGYVAVGVGLRNENDIVKHLNQDDWDNILLNTGFDTSILDGHFLVVGWDEEKVELKNDFLGLRTAYLYTDEEQVTYFSTRLDWLSNVIQKPEIDLFTFGAHWVLINQFNNECFLKNVKRLGPSAHAICKKGTVTIEEELFSPSFEISSIEDFNNELEAYSNPQSDFNLSVGLSGGLDSRTVLSAVSSTQDVEAYCFGNKANPDVYIAEHVARESRVAHLFYEETIPLFKDSEREILDYIGQLQGVSPVHGFYRENVLRDINSRNKLMIDGGFGEIHRRQFMGRLAFMNSKKPAEISIEELFNSLTESKFNFFKKSVSDQMIEGSKSQVSTVWEKAILNSDSNLGNCIDLFSLYSRISNTSAMDHSWSDSLTPAYMPFVQKGMLKVMFGLPIEKRINGRLFRGFIRKHNNTLSKLPLVKSGLTYPFSLGKYTSTAFIRMKKKFVNPYHDTSGRKFLLENKDYVMDLMISNKVRECELYEYNVIKETVEGFYKGNYGLELSVTQWLGFELWRNTTGF